LTTRTVFIPSLAKRKTKGAAADCVIKGSKFGENQVNSAVARPSMSYWFVSNTRSPALLLVALA